MCENYFMPDFVTSACIFMWSIHRPMKIGTGSELPDTWKMWHMGKPSAPEVWKWLYRYGRMAMPACKPLQRPKIWFRKRRSLFVGNHTSGTAKVRIWAFLRPLWLRCLNDKTSHRLQGEDIANCLQSLIFERRERGISNLDGWPSGNLPCIASQSPLHDLLRIWHIRKTQDDVILWSGLYITYRAILNIGLYNWLLQTGLLKLRFCITAYLYRDIHYHAVAPDVKLYTYTSISPIHLYPRYIHKCYNPIQIYLV